MVKCYLESIFHHYPTNTLNIRLVHDGWYALGVSYGPWNKYDLPSLLICGISRHAHQVSDIFLILHMVVFTKLTMDLVSRQFATGLLMVIFMATYPFICVCIFSPRLYLGTYLYMYVLSKV